MAEEHVKAVFLTAEGAKALEHLADYIRDGNVLDCSEISAEGAFVEVKAKLQKDWGKKLKIEIEVHLLIPVHFVQLVVLDEVKNPMGFK